MEDNLNLLIDAYKRRLNIINEMIKESKSAGEDVRLKIKRGMIRSFLHELEQLNKDK